jgi:hypothetical protein
VKTRRKKKSFRAKPHKTGFGGFYKLTQSEVEWLKEDSRKTLIAAEELQALTARMPEASNVTDESATKEQLLEEEKFTHHLRLATAVNLARSIAISGAACFWAT